MCRLLVYYPYVLTGFTRIVLDYYGSVIIGYTVSPSFGLRPSVLTGPRQGGMSKKNSTFRLIEQDINQTPVKPVPFPPH